MKLKYLVKHDSFWLYHGEWMGTDNKDPGLEASEVLCPKIIFNDKVCITGYKFVEDLNLITPMYLLSESS